MTVKGRRERGGETKVSEGGESGREGRGEREGGRG